MLLTRIIGGIITESVADAVKEPSAVITVMVVLPSATPRTRPVGLTVATPRLELLKVIALFVAVVGRIVAVN